MKRFVINLDRASERLAWMDANFERLRLSYERVAAVDQELLSDDTLDKIVNPRGMNLTRGEVACFLSHIAVWKQVAEGSDEFAAVFEDDVHFSQDAAKYLKDSAWVPAGTEIIKLETMLIPVFTGRAGMNRKGHKLLLLLSYHFGTAGYIVSKRLARKLVAASAMIDRPVDDFMFDVTDLIFDKDHTTEIWQMEPALCVQDMALFKKEATLPKSIEAGRELMQERRRKRKPKLSLMQKLRRELKRVARQLLKGRGRIIPIEVDIDNL